jgi:hypothetical protein
MKKLAAILLLFAAAFAAAQTGILLPAPRLQFFDANGKPLAGGFVFTYAAGTSVGLPTYTDSTATVLNPNPIILDSAGMAAIYLQNATSYKFVVQNSLGVMQWTADNVKLVSSAQVGGLNTQVQFNCGGAFCGSSGFTYNSGTQTLTVTSLNITSGGSLAGVFSGSPTLSGVWTFNAQVNVNSNLYVNALWSNPALCTTPPDASTGFIHMCVTDVVNWRNATNTGDEGISTDLSDRFNVSHLNGLMLTGSAPNLRFGGSTALFPMWKRVNAGLSARLADDSADASVSGSTVSWGGASGPTLNGPCAATQVLQASSPTSVSCASLTGAVIQQQSITLLGGSVAIAGSPSNSAVLTKVVTMPASGCPCRVFMSYGLYWSTTNAGQFVAWVSDGSNNTATSETATTGSASNFGSNGGAFSAVTYGNGAVVTFTLTATQDAGGSVNALVNNGTTQGQVSWMNVVVFPNSN